MKNAKFAILITTKNRLEDLKLTLQKISHLIQQNDVKCIVCDDGSTDGTFEHITAKHQDIQIFRNEKSKGLIYSRNRLLEKINADYAISLDDDAHFLTNHVLETIESFFLCNMHCGLIALRVFWGKEEPFIMTTEETSYRVNAFVGCGHAWRMEAWRSIPNYPEWFQFYGEENFASLQLLKHNWQVHYVPDILVQHRVDMKARKKDKDYVQRQRRSLRSGWYLYFMCYPKRIMFRKFTASLWHQLKSKVFKGSFIAAKVIILAMFDLIIHIPKIVKGNFRLSNKEYQEFIKLPNVKIYWKPEDE